MKRLILAVMFVCALAPSAARADDGGWWDFIYGLDPKLVGWGTDIHLLCIGKDSKRIDTCEEWWGLRRKFNNYANLGHEFDFRVAFYREYGQSYDTSNANSIKAWKFMGMYYYHPDTHITVGLGGGIMPFYGKSSDGLAFDTFTRGVLTPLSVTYAPATLSNPHWLIRTFYLRGDSTFYPEGFSPGDFDKRLPKTETKGEWSFSLASGFDFRRR